MAANLISQARVTDDWVPLPEKLLRHLDWKEGDILELEVVGDQILVTRVSAAVPGVTPPKPAAPARRKS